MIPREIGLCRVLLEYAFLIVSSQRQKAQSKICKEEECSGSKPVQIGNPYCLYESRSYESFWKTLMVFASDQQFRTFDAPEYVITAICVRHSLLTPLRFVWLGVHSSHWEHMALNQGDNWVERTSALHCCNVHLDHYMSQSKPLPPVYCLRASMGAWLRNACKWFRTRKTNECDWLRR